MAKTKTCKICGKEFLAKSYKATMCSSECRKIRNLEIAREQNERRKAMNAEKAKQSKVRKPKEKTNRDKITEIAIAARKEGLTYGQYVAKYMGRF